jgi:hypothetical protein
MSLFRSANEPDTVGSHACHLINGQAITQTPRFGGEKAVAERKASSLLTPTKHQTPPKPA